MSTAEKNRIQRNGAKNKRKSARFRATKEGREYMRAYGQKKDLMKMNKQG